MIFSKCRDKFERQFYLTAVKRYGWTKRVLEHQIENKTYEKFLLNQTNFDRTVQGKYRDQRSLAIKDHHTFEFLELSEEHSERELEIALLRNILS